MSPPPGFDVEGVHYGPTPGVKSSYSKEYLVEKIGEICGFEKRKRSNYGCLSVAQLEQLVDSLDAEPENNDKRSLVRAVAEVCGFRADLVNYNCFDKDELWAIHQELQEEGDS